MKKKKIANVVLGLSLLVSMCASFVPKSIQATGEPLKDVPLYIDRDTPTTSDTNNHYTYDKGERTLVLNGVNFTSTTDPVIVFDDDGDGSPYTIKVIGNNVLNYESADRNPCIDAIDAKIKIVFEENASLTLNSVRGGITAEKSLEIYGEEGSSLILNTEGDTLNVTKETIIENSTITFGTRNNNIYGIFGIVSQGNIGINNSELIFKDGKQIRGEGDLNIDGGSKITMNENNNSDIINLAGLLNLSDAAFLNIDSRVDTGLLCNVKQLNMKDTSTLHIKGNNGSVAIGTENEYKIGDKKIISNPAEYNTPNIVFNHYYYIGKAGDTSKFANEVTIADDSESEVPPTQDPIVPTPEEPTDIPSIDKDMQHTWNNALGKGLTFKIEGTYTEIKGVEVNKETVEATSYDTDKEASTLTLKKDYLDTLPTGSHEVAILVDDKRVETTFTIDKADNKADTNGDNSLNKDTSTTTNNNPSNTVDNTNNKQSSPSTNTSNIRLVGIMMILVGSILGLVVLRKKAIKN